MALGRLGALLTNQGVRWALGGAVALIVVEGVLTLAGEERYFLSVLSLIVLVTVGGWAIQHYRGVFRVSLGRLTAMTQIGRDDRTAEYVNTWDHRLFDPLATGAVLVVFTVGVLWFITLFMLGPVFENRWIDWATYVFFVPVVVVGVRGSFIAIGAVWAVRLTADRQLEAHFSVVRNPVIADMEQGWRTAGVFILVVYLLLLTAFGTGPYELDWLLTLWLAAFVLFPIAWFFAGSHQLHRMLSTLKTANLDQAQDDVRSLTEAMQSGVADVTRQEFNAALDIEAKVQAMPAWPSTPGGISGFIFAVAPLAIQVSLVYSGVADTL